MYNSAKKFLLIQQIADYMVDMDATAIIASFGSPQNFTDAVNAGGVSDFPDGKPLTVRLVYCWRDRGRFPADWYPHIAAAIDHQRVDVTLDDLINHVRHIRPPELMAA